jgi:hypothetical protein
MCDVERFNLFLVTIIVSKKGTAGFWRPSLIISSFIQDLQYAVCVIRPEKKRLMKTYRRSSERLKPFFMLIVSEKQFFLRKWFSNLNLDTKKLSN